ncbi:CocE/NonD family hydrolase [Halomonas rhizosphaerae]|uniref:CocE/NonD family hydrolase n=1 Tax=Halomonas rhizosphaerae TaxID=3043296 RepID=A0ABT6V102_9GAMM|nr:CocE/NonD family hydrolase [Halomonas rhizosphaerae]MDI5891876.1 CocE/NonD family hydrolase [Halomonas rhizosphaerae]
MVQMRDGVELYTRVWLPKKSPEGARLPVVLTRGYRAGRAEDAAEFTSNGYAYVGQATRGHAPSEGELNRFFNDAEDGYDTLTWISNQDWNDGNIAMYGRSYWGATQWLVAPEQHPNLKAIIPQGINADLWQCVYRCYGALTLAMTASGRAYQDSKQASRYGWKELYNYLPLIDLDLEVSKTRNRLWRDYVSHSKFDDFWKEISLKGKYHRVKIPVFMMSGWYDYYAGAAFENYKSLRESGHVSDIRIAINPSDHVNRVVGDRSFGHNASKNDIKLAIDWLDHVIKKIDNGIEEQPPIQIFTMGVNEWRFIDEWPLPNTEFTPFYLRSPDGSRLGRLDTTPPENEAPSTFIYDPEDPVPTLGGNHSFLGKDHPELIRVGAVDQRPNEKRDDVLVFTSDPLEMDLEVTGPIEIVLYAASSAKDTDFTAKLIDVYPDGTAYNLTEGIIRARFRNSIWEEPKLLVPGKIYSYTLKLQPTSNVFLRGHRIRVHITSSNFPLWDRNPNTGNEQGIDDELRVAEQTIYHSSEYPSRIILPLIPK